MQCALVVFAWVFPENSRTPRRRAAILFAPSLVLIPTALIGLCGVKLGFRTENSSLTSRPLAYAFVVYVYVISAMARTFFSKISPLSRNAKRSAGRSDSLAVAITGVLKPRLISFSLLRHF
jgi:hypothetical protein